MKYCTILRTIDQRLCMLKVSKEAQNTPVRAVMLCMSKVLKEAQNTL